MKNFLRTNSFLKGGVKIELINEKFENLRKKTGVKLKDIEKETGISSDYLAKIEEGKTKNPPIHVMEKIADYFHVSLLHFVDEQLAWYEDLSAELKNFLTVENLEYLKVLSKAKKENISAEELNIALDYLKEIKAEINN